jgi:guanylate kinase
VRHFLFVLIGSTGSGKTELTKRAMERLGLKRIISCTTRPKRESEVDGVAYRFLTVEAFQDGLRRGHFVEYDRPYGEHYYGRQYADISLVGQYHCICDMTEIGVAALQESGRYPKALYIRLEPINMPAIARADDRKEGDAKRAAIPIHIDHVIRNDHGNPVGLTRAIDDLCSYIEQHIHPES